METVFKGSVVLIANLNLKILDLQIFNVEGSHNFLKRNLELAHIKYLVVLAYSFIGEKNGIFIAMST